MNVDIARELKFSKLDHLFVLVAEGNHDGLPETVRTAIREAKFVGRSDESITILAGAPRKLTLIGMAAEVSAGWSGIGRGVLSSNRARSGIDRVVSPVSLTIWRPWVA